jgi:hypothetical protein
MPKVTLLAEEYQDRTVFFGKKSYLFPGGKEISVPLNVAQYCVGQTRGGEKVYTVTGIEASQTQAPTAPAPPKQNVEVSRSGFTQLRLIEAELCH